MRPGLCRSYKEYQQKLIKKYGSKEAAKKASDEWFGPNPMPEESTEHMEHIYKGKPRDVVKENNEKLQAALKKDFKRESSDSEKEKKKEEPEEEAVESPES